MDHIALAYLIGGIFFTAAAIAFVTFIFFKSNPLKKREIDFRLPVPHRVTYTSALGEGFFMVCTEDKTAHHMEGANTAIECWEMFSGSDFGDPEFKTLIAHYESIGWYCIHSKKRR